MLVSGNASEVLCTLGGLMSTHERKDSESYLTQATNALQAPTCALRVSQLALSSACVPAAFLAYLLMQLTLQHSVP